MDPSNLLEEVSTCSNKVSWVLLVNHNFCRQQLAILAFDGFEKFLDLLSVRVTLVNVFVKCVEALGHNLSALFEAHASLILVMQLIKSCFGDSHPLA